MSNVIENATELADDLELEGRDHSAKRVHDLLAIVRKLPVTADGVVVVPQVETVWSIVGGSNYLERAIDRRYNPKSPSKRKNGWWTRPKNYTNYEYDDLPVSSCYSTRAAAEAAREASK